MKIHAVGQGRAILRLGRKGETGRMLCLTRFLPRARGMAKTRRERRFAATGLGTTSREQSIVGEPTRAVL